MQTTSQIRYENVDLPQIVQFTTLLSDPEGITVAGRLQNWVDADGSVYGQFIEPAMGTAVAARFLGKPVQMGSMRAFNWWRINGDCLAAPNVFFALDELWLCPRAPGDASASLIVSYDVAEQSDVGGDVCVNGNWYGNQPCPVVGKVTHFGHAEGTATLELALNSKITGPVIADSGGWFIRFAAGTPESVTFEALQIDVDVNLVVALPYPSDTIFSISAFGAGWCSDSWATCQHAYTPVSSATQVRDGFGDTYYFDSAAGVLYLRVVYYASGTLGPPGDTAAWSTANPVSLFARGGLALVEGGYADIGDAPADSADFYITVTATSCPASGCAPNPNAVVPPAFGALPPSVAPTTKGPTATAMPTFAPVVERPTLSPLSFPPSPSSSPVSSAPTSQRPTTPSKSPVSRSPTKKPTPRPK